MVVTDNHGTVISQVATLTVQTSISLPASLVAFWSAEGNANDGEGTNHGTLANGVTFAPVQLRLEQSGANILLTWPQGILQGADDVTGPWSDVSGAASPYLVTPKANEAFYRVRVL